MRLSQYPINTAKETPAEAEIISHQLMLRAGLIRRLAAGLYSWLPMGLRSLQKVERIVREEMNRAGAFELVMPVIQPAELWQESGRWTEYGPELLRIKDRHQRDFVAGPTHEEVITDIARRELRSYRQLPVNFYQIQTKFRDEVRPRFGVMRAREFIMKDAYSFHLDEQSLREGYRAMYDAYTRIFTRTGLTFRAVRADSGAIGGDVSQEFHVLAASGEDAIVFSDGDDYAANLEAAAAAPPPGARPAAREPLRQRVDPGRAHHRGAGAVPRDRAGALREDPDRRRSRTMTVVALVLRGDHELNAGQGAQAARRRRPPADGERRAGTRGHRHRPGLGGSGRPQVPRVRRSQRARARGLRLRRERERRAPHRRELGPRRAASHGRRPAQRRGRRPEPLRQGTTEDRPRHRGRPYLPARHGSTASP